MAKSCFSSTTISGIVVLTVFATICSVGLLLYLLFGFKKGRERYGNRLLKKITVSSQIQPVAGCNGKDEKSVSEAGTNTSIRKPERKHRVGSDSSGSHQASSSSNSGCNNRSEAHAYASAEMVPEIPSDPQTFAIRAANLDMFDVKLAERGDAKDICLVPRAGSDIGTRLGGELKLLSVSVEGLDFMTVERVLSAAQDALLICSSSRGKSNSLPLVPFSRNSQSCLVDMDTLAVVSLLDQSSGRPKMDCSAQVSPQHYPEVVSKLDAVSVAIQVEDDFDEDQLMYHTASDSGLNENVEDEARAVDQRRRRLDMTAILERYSNPPSSPPKPYSQSVPDLRVETDKSPSSNQSETEEKSVRECAQMQPINVQEIMDFIDKAKQNVLENQSVKADESDGRPETEVVKHGDEDTWEAAVRASLKAIVDKTVCDVQLSQEHTDRLNHFQQQFAKHCEDLTRLGISLGRRGSAEAVRAVKNA